jgi:hypothetical protein
MSIATKRLIATLAAVGLLTGCAASPQLELQPLGPTNGANTRSVQSESFPIPVVELRGSPAELGEQQGDQLDTSIHYLHDKYLLVYIGGVTKRFLALSTAKLFEHQLRPEHRAELIALASSTKINESETMLGQCFLDMADMAACSTITLPASASPDHVARFGRDLDFTSLNIADKYTTLFIVHPDDGRYAYAAVGWPGMIGVLSGMNEHGLCLANMEVPRQFRFPDAMPYTLLYRTVLERCRTVDEAVKLLQSTPRQSANNLMLMDAAGNRAVVELRPESVHVRRGTENAALISTNHQRDQDADTTGRCYRYDFLHEQSATEFGSIGVAEIHGMLAHVGNHTTLQSMIFEPANRTIYLATGSSAASRRMYRKQLFEPDGDVRQAMSNGLNVGNGIR